MSSIKKGKKVSVKLIADYFIWKSNQEKKGITNKKIQKLLYYSQAWYLVFNKHRLFKDKIEAWVHGPAVRSIYLEFKSFGYLSIDKKVLKKEVDKIGAKIINFLEDIWNVYGKHDARYLELLTHNEDPWQKARQGLGTSEASDNEISLDEMKSYYSKFIKE